MTVFMVTIRGFHLLWLLHGIHPVVVSTLLWCPPSHGFHSAVVSNLPWLFRGVHPGFWLKLAWKWQFSWLPSVVSTSCGDSVVSAILKHILLPWLSGRKWNHSLFVNWLPGLWLEISLEMTTFVVTTCDVCGFPRGVSVVSSVVSSLFLSGLPRFWLKVSLEMTTFMVTHGVHGGNNVVVCLSVKSHCKVMWPP